MKLSGRNKSNSLSLNDSLRSFDGSAFSVGLVLGSSLGLLLCCLLLGVDLASLGPFDLEGVKHLLEVCGLLDRDDQKRGLLRLNLDDRAVGPLDHEIGNLDDFRVAVSHALQVQNVVLLLSEDVLKKVDVSSCGSAADEDLAGVARSSRRVFG